MNILVLCHGNINRSPACAAVLKQEFPELEVKSGGFGPGNKPATKKMRDMMAEEGYSLEGHRSKTVTQDMVDWADKVVIMDGGNLKRFLRLFGDDDHKLLKLGEYHNPPKTRIPDPGYMPRGSEELGEIGRASGRERV